MCQRTQEQKFCLKGAVEGFILPHRFQLCATWGSLLAPVSNSKGGENLFSKPSRVDGTYIGLSRSRQPETVVHSVVLHSWATIRVGAAATVFHLHLSQWCLGPAKANSAQVYDGIGRGFSSTTKLEFNYNFNNISFLFHVILETLYNIGSSRE